MKKSSDELVYGAFEQVVLPALSPVPVIAKIDTGAYSGAIHCSVLREHLRHNRKYLRFKPLATGEMQETSKYIHKYVRSSTGHLVSRYLIDTQITIQDKTYDIRIGLSNRSDMQYEVLIGRRFLREHGIIVDVRINQEYDMGDKGNGAML